MNIQSYLKGFTAQHAGMVLIFQPVVMATFSLLAGRLSDKIETRVVASIGKGFSVTGLFLFMFIDPDTHLGFIITSQMLGMGITMVLFGLSIGRASITPKYSHCS
jgi:predicted MFS family arabinose efflux permease